MLMAMAVPILCVGTVSMTGCLEPTTGRGPAQPVNIFAPPPPKPVDDPNIIGVRKFVSQEPWLSFNREGLRKVEGLKATVYLESGTTGRGAFGDGTLRVTVYSIEKLKDNSERLKREYRWDLEPAQTTPWRVKQPSRLGWAYGLRLKWGDEVQVAGKEVELSFQFVRRDGQIISAEPLRMRVPVTAARLATGAEEAEEESAPRPVAPKLIPPKPAQPPKYPPQR